METALNALVRYFEQELQRRHEAGEFLPPGETVMACIDQSLLPRQFCFDNLSDNPRSRTIRCAPFVAAHISLHGTKPHEQSMGLEARH